MIWKFYIINRLLINIIFNFNILCGRRPIIFLLYYYKYFFFFFFFKANMYGNYFLNVHPVQNLPLLMTSLAEVFSSQAASLSLLAASPSLPHCSLLCVAWPAAWPPTWAIRPASLWPKAMTLAELILLLK